MGPEGKPVGPGGPVDGSPVFLSSVVDRLFAGESGQGLLPDETLGYQVRAKWGWIPLSGKMQGSVKREKYSGREVYRLEQSIRVFGRYLDEVSIIDAEGLFPCEYTRKMRRVGEEELIESLSWDHFGQKIYATRHRLRKGKPAKQLRYEEFRLGVDIAGDAIDPLSAVFLYRLKCVGQTNAVAWKKTVIAGPGERYVLNCTPTGSVSVVTNDFAGTCRVARVNWFWDAGSSTENRLITTVLSLEKDAVPLSYAATIWEIPGTAALRDCRRTPHPDPLPQGEREKSFGGAQRNSLVN